MKWRPFPSPARTLGLGGKWLEVLEMGIVTGGAHIPICHGSEHVGVGWPLKTGPNTDAPLIAGRKSILRAASERKEPVILQWNFIAGEAIATDALAGTLRNQWKAVPLLPEVETVTV